jgi:rare lipoprotein A
MIKTPDGLNAVGGFYLPYKMKKDPRMNIKYCGFVLSIGALVSGVVEAQTPASAPAAAPTQQAAPAAAPSATTEEGLAAVYTDKLAGHVTASGKKYDPSKLTAAHKTLPFGTRVKVTNQKNGKSVELRITDRGPKQPDRILDISRHAAKMLGISRYGMAKVSLEVIS